MKEHFGYTLIELMVALAVLAVAMTYGVPRLSVYFQGNRMVTNTNDLVAGFHLARSEAIKLADRVTICKSADALSCTTTGGWEQGWIVFQIDSSRAVPNLGDIDQYQTANNDVLLRVHSKVSGSDVKITAPTGSIAANYVSFTSRGVPKLPSGAIQSEKFTVCDSRGLQNASSGNVTARAVILNPTGRVRTSNLAADIDAVKCP